MISYGRYTWDEKTIPKIQPLVDIIYKKNYYGVIFFTKLIIISATFFILSTVPTEVPPNLSTTIFIDKFYLYTLNLI